MHFPDDKMGGGGTDSGGIHLPIRTYGELEQERIGSRPHGVVVLAGQAQTTRARVRVVQ